MKRPPIVVVMGHVDHGKTTLLDYIRKTNVAAKEVGGITQSIGAYEIKHALADSTSSPQAGSTSAQRITFIDTPGHEAFTMMRQRGAKVADIGILVVAADDGVQNQTKEAFKILQDSKTTIIVAINKVDKSGTDINKVKNDLAQAGILLEGYGGSISWQAISAKTGQGVSELLDLILLTAELENLEYDPKAQAAGFILESKLDSRRGMVASVIVKNGALKIGDEIFASGAKGKVKSLENFLGQRIEKAIPSNPVLILGFESLAKVGEEFSADKFPIGNFQLGIKENKLKEPNAEENTVNLILKADTAGSLEALSAIIKNLPAENKFKIIDEAVGEITDGNVKLAISTKATIIGFKIKPNKMAENLARAQSVKIIISEIIYDLVKIIEEHIKNFGQETMSGDLEILAVFGKKGDGQIIGGKVTLGDIKNNSILEVKRQNQVVGKRRVVNLQQGKSDVKKVDAGNECGLLFNSDIIINAGDHLISKQ